MAAANTITPLKDWRYGIPGHGKPLTEQEREELLRKGWSKKPSPLVNPVLGNQLKINPGNTREQLMAGLDPISGNVLVNIIKGGNKSGASYKHALSQLQKHAPGAVKRLEMQGFL